MQTKVGRIVETRGSEHSYTSTNDQQNDESLCLKAKNWFEIENVDA